MADETFGDTDKGATATLFGEWVAGLVASPANDGTANSITCSISSGGSSGERAKVVLYNDDATSVLAISAEEVATDGDHTWDFVTPYSVLAANDYIVAFLTKSGTTIILYFNVDGGSFVRLYDSDVNFTTGECPSPFVGDTDARGYLFCTYTPGDGEAHEHTASDTVAISDAFSAKMDFKQALSDSVNISDSMAPVAKFKQALADTVGITDSLATVATYKYSTSDTMDISDVMAAAAAYKVALADTITISDEMAYDIVILEIKRRAALARKIGLPRAQNIGIGI